MRSSTKNVVTSALLLASGLVLPMAFHAVGLGKAFLPMHIPVLFAGFLLDLPWAVAVGALTPFLSSVLTGMPVFFPVMPTMVCELAAYAAVGNLLGKRAGLNPYVSLIGAMIAGRVVAGVAVWGIATLFAAKLPGPVAWIVSAVTTGVPGIVIQLIVVPPAVALFQRSQGLQPSAQTGQD